MFLKNLEIVGFKSFVDTTQIDFTHGFTAIVGPNGCGKSNISDAIRWVIGEQSSKTLRGTRITDLIFNGTEARKQVNRAEISLTLSDIPPGLRIANVPNPDSEITVTRCCHRSGESEYYINKIPCRLKDISDLFLDIGVSPKAMTVIEQNHINNIINSKPEDRRFMIEEAAGILKFKHRKLEALRKLDVSSQNLARINDIVQELSRQVESLKRQAAKARRFKEYKAQIKTLSLNLYSTKCRQLNIDFQLVKEEFDKNDEQKAQWVAQASSMENRITQMKLENGEAESSLQRKQETVQDLGNKIRTNEHNIALKNAEIKQAQQDIDAAGEEIRLMNEEIDSLAVEKDNCGTQLEEISKKRVVQENNRDEQVEALNADKTLRQQKENVLRKKEQRMLTLYQQLSQKNNELTALQTRTQFLCSRMEKQNQEKAETREQIKKNLEHLQAVEENHAAKTKQFTLLQSEHGELSRQIGECQNRIKEENESLSSLKETYLSSASLLGSLNELWKKFEGFQDGVKSLMSNTNGDRLPGLREVLVDVLRAPAEYEMAVEAVLGEKLQSVIVDTYSDSVNAISYLNANRSGRGSFIPVQFKSTHQTPLLLNGNSGVVGKVVDLIQCKEEYRPLLHHLLNNVVLVSDLETGLKLYADENFNGTVVTRNGELIDAQGTVSGGSRDENSNLLTQKRKMETLATQVESRKREVESAQSKHDALVHRLEELQESLKKIGVHLHETEIAGAHIKNDMEHLQKEIGRLEQKQSTLDYELSNADHESQELTDHQDALQQKIREEEAEKTEEEQKVAALKIELEQHHIVIESKSQELNALLVEIASTQGKIENLQTERQRLNLQQEILRQKIDQRDQSRRNNASQIDRRRVNVGELEKEILQQTEERDRLNKEITMEAETLQLKTEELNQMELESKTLSRKVQEITETISKIEIKLSEIRILNTQLEERAYSEFSVTMQEMLQDYTEEIDQEKAQEEVDVLKEKVRKMGDVNLEALSEYQKTSERFNFLNQQQEDLAQSIQTLHSAIDKVNRTIKERFQVTFQQVNENFQSIFARVFQGGKAHLTLTDESDPLESGIEISAQPPGKKMQNISLLSAGEKALTAVSLIFAIFKVRPSPFCLLDEVDAPLDESNLLRFQNLLREMSTNTQFILITHNQKTMAFADILYGVTMEERGVSKVVSVNLN